MMTLIDKIKQIETMLMYLDIDPEVRLDSESILLSADEQAIDALFLQLNQFVEKKELLYKQYKESRAKQLLDNLKNNT